MTTSTPAHVPQKGVEKFNTWFAFGLITIAGLALLYFSVTYYLFAARLARLGVETTAQVVLDMQPRNTDKLHPNNKVSLRFTTATGQVVQAKMNIPQEVYRRILPPAEEKSQTARIRYLPSDPQEVDMVGEDVRRRNFILVTGLTGLLLFLYGIAGFRKTFKHSHLTSAHHRHIADW